MLTRAQVEAASSTIDELTSSLMVAVVRNSDEYKKNPAYYEPTLLEKIEDADGTVQAQQLNAALTAIENLGIGVVEIDQRKVSNSDGLYYSTLNSRNALVEYFLGVLYPKPYETTAVTTATSSIGGNFGVTQRGCINELGC